LISRDGECFYRLTRRSLGEAHERGFPFGHAEGLQERVRDAGVSVRVVHVEHDGRGVEAGQLAEHQPAVVRIDARKAVRHAEALHAQVLKDQGVLCAIFRCTTGIIPANINYSSQKPMTVL